MGKTVQTQSWLKKCYKEAAPSQATIFRWISEFKRGRMDTTDAERSGRPNEAVTPENVQNIHQIVLKNRKIKVRG